MQQLSGVRRSEVDRVSNRTPARRAFPINPPGGLTVDARYVGREVEYVTKKIHRPEWQSLLIIIAVLLGGLTVLFLIALLAGWF